MAMPAAVAVVLLVVVTAMRQPMSAANGRDVTGGRDTVWPARFGIGRPATKAEIAAWDISIRPDGKGLPPGSGNARTGREIYANKIIGEDEVVDAQQLPKVVMPAKRYFVTDDRRGGPEVR